MSKQIKLKEITSMEEDFGRWFTDVCVKAKLIDYSDLKGFYILRPYGYAIWERISNELDRRFKETSHENVSMPLLIPESLLQKEKDHVEGFAPECAWVTIGGSEELPERLCIRPTSETLFCQHWANIVSSWRDLPCLYNQWCSVLRWEKTTRPFLRGREFLWQEGHTIHETEEEAVEETIRMLNVYADFCENILAMPVIKGRKTDKEKFAGAIDTYTIECMMHDKKALQSATSHYFGDGFSRAFDVKFQDRENKEAYPHQTSWGMTTRIIGAIIMTHGDNNGLILPPNIAPHQLIIVPIAAHKGGVIEKAAELEARLKKADIRVKSDYSDNSPGWKFSEWEMMGVPLRLEIGPRDIEENSCILARRDTGEKIKVSLENIEDEVKRVLSDVQKSLYNKALNNREENSFEAGSLEELKELIEEHKGGFVKTMWCGCRECEEKVKEYAGVTSRCIPLEQENLGETCAICGKKAEMSIIWGLAY